MLDNYDDDGDDCGVGDSGCGDNDHNDGESCYYYAARATTMLPQPKPLVFPRLLFVPLAAVFGWQTGGDQSRGLVAQGGHIACGMFNIIFCLPSSLSLR